MAFEEARNDRAQRRDQDHGQQDRRFAREFVDQHRARKRRMRGARNHARHSRERQPRWPDILQQRNEFTHASERAADECSDQKRRRKESADAA